MTHLLSIPENVMIQYLFPKLDHNDLLRLRRTSKQTKALADAYLWTPQPGHQGRWILKIDSSKEDHKLKAFLQMDLPPPSRLHIANEAEKGPSEQRSFFEDDHLEEFMNRYSKYVTTLKIDKLFFPFTSAKEISFYESLVNLKKLRCKEMITVRGAAQFEDITKMAERTFLMPRSFKNVKVFKLDCTDSIESMWTFINGLSSNLEELLHPFDQKQWNNWFDGRTNFACTQQFIERRRGGIKSQSKLLYDWKYAYASQLHDPLERLRVFASCHENGVMIKNLDGWHLDCLLWNENGMIDKKQVIDPLTGEWIWNSRVNYRRNQLIGNIIHSLNGVMEDAFLVELPALKKINIDGGYIQARRRHGVGYPQWPNLRKMNVELDHCSESNLRFLLGQIRRPKLEELTLVVGTLWEEANLKIPFPRDLGNFCGNVKKLSVNCPWANPFFVGLWNGLPLLEDVTLKDCPKLTNKGFVGNDGSRPVFLKLKRLRHLSVQNLEQNPKITDAVFRDVFRHLKVTSFKLSSSRAVKKITLAGIMELLTGSFAETIEKLDLDQFELNGVSKQELKDVVSCFRSSKMV